MLSTADLASKVLLSAAEFGIVSTVNESVERLEIERALPPHKVDTVVRSQERRRLYLVRARG